MPRFRLVLVVVVVVVVVGGGGGAQYNCGGGGILGKCNLSSSLASTGDTLFLSSFLYRRYHAFTGTQNPSCVHSFFFPRPTDSPSREGGR